MQADLINLLDNEFAQRDFYNHYYDHETKDLIKSFLRIQQKLLFKHNNNNNNNNINKMEAERKLRALEQVLCICGTICLEMNLKRHKQSNKHQKYIFDNHVCEECNNEFISEEELAIHDRYYHGIL